MTQEASALAQPSQPAAPRLHLTTLAEHPPTPTLPAAGTYTVRHPPLLHRLPHGLMSPLTQSGSLVILLLIRTFIPIHSFTLFPGNLDIGQIHTHQNPHPLFHSLPYSFRPFLTHS
ncbi:hypothetical protein E2C01_017259 [Portunus trituberculatus]|uniref:Uncharacterized protein n=1 Tax=Portunus trituberculatus TaxID=210409 RepID=A0A5B7DSX4_PORTR|nr:hypothetical protein [Portunus trituberculatus]